MADDLTARIVDLVAKALAEREAAGPAPAPRAATPATAPAVVTGGRVVTREDVQRAALPAPRCRCRPARS